MNNNAVTGAELELINKYSRKQLGADDVYTFTVILCDNDIDRDNEHFSDSALDELAKMFVGVTGIYDHEPSARNQVARIYDCKTEYVEGKTTVYGAPYKRLAAKAYIPVCKSSEELIAMLDSGIKKEVSVGCGIAKCTCSICGEDMRIGACSHRKGRRYEGKLCCGILNDPTDAYEWSFTAVPAQRRAGVVKSCTLSEEATFKRVCADLDRSGDTEIAEYIKSLRLQAEECERYKAKLRLDTVKAGVTAKIGIESSLLESMVKGLSADELFKLKSCFEEAADRRFPARMQTAADRNGADRERDSQNMKQYTI